MKELKKILYAEDDTDIQTIVSTIIEAMSPYDLKICYNGRILLDCVEEFEPDLILLDVMMPEMNGPDTFKKLTENPKTKDIPVIFMTAKAQVHEVKAMLESGILGIITKPFDPMQLVASIDEYWKEYNANGQ